MQRLKKSTVFTSFSKFRRFLSTSINIIEANHVRTQQNQSSLKSSINNALVNGRVDLLHGQAIKTGKVQYCDIYNYLLSLYVKKHELNDAGKLFEEIPARDVHSWTILITGFARMGLAEKALGLFNEMQIEGVCPNHFTLSCAFKCCGSVSDLGMGKKIHGWMLINGIGLDITLENSMVDFYVKCGDFDCAKRVFEMMAEKNITSWNIIIGAYLAMGDMDTSIELFSRLPSKDVASWNTIIIGLIRHGCLKRALELFYEMCRTRAVFNDNTYSIALLLAASLSATEVGRQIHGYVFRMGYDQNKFIRSSIVNMYSKCGELDKASKILNKEPQKSENIHTSTSNCGLLETNVSWSSIISGYVQSGRTEEAFELFRRMVCEAVEMDPFTLTSIAAACADVGVSEWGRGIHTLIEKLGYIIDDVLVSAMIDMYAKCGSLHDALSLFRQTNSRNIVLWTSMISGCALHGQGTEAIRIFQMMLEKRIRPNEISFIGVLSGCSHAGLVEEGHVYFRSMHEHYGIAPQVEHFTCMVDLLGRAGHFNEAKEFIYSNNVSHLSSVWKALLSACQIHKNFELGKWVSKQLHQIEPFNSESYVLLSNIYSTTHRWKEAAETRSLMQKRGFKKHPGQSWIRLKNQIHTFSVGDRSHPQAAEIYSYLEKLIGKLKEIGYSSNTNLVMHDVEEEQREILLGFHSEKLAIAYGIMSTPSKTPILVLKNLRVCVDCHSAIKYISQITGREITVRDAHRFHHFSGGYCSCGDYW
ncbi:hypothetical protein AQUCO_05800121v1 [Aquilegia coerulea]|uniref:DYW domain-containing protein n=1 Tax=Aquilegia coerulea TaxID=218851 RepID=A0A2G5CEZ3_AQUCA|nr:hypothetical protein AQUCO_05800121v1 [Aquilegia coerulea]